MTGDDAAIVPNARAAGASEASGPGGEGVPVNRQVFLRALALAAVLGAASMAGAQGLPPQSGPRAFIAQELPYYGIRDVDVRALSTSQVVQIYTLMNSPRGQGDKARLIRSALGRGLFGAWRGNRS